MSKETAERREQLKKLIDRPQNCYSSSNTISQRIGGVQGTTQKDMQFAYDHANCELMKETSRYSKLLEAELARVRHEVARAVEDLGWDGEDGGPGTAEMRERVCRLVEHRWKVEELVCAMGARE